ncbi:hypothetical protein ANRL3_02767 [Anaerolineae bacterium]|nr:hypothetical protein ANRL3_02767 [Anaerolineae bacterium]
MMGQKDHSRINLRMLIISHGPLGWIATHNISNQQTGLKNRSSIPAPRTGVVFSVFGVWRGVLIAGIRCNKYSGV